MYVDEDGKMVYRLIQNDSIGLDIELYGVNTGSTILSSN